MTRFAQTLSWKSWRREERQSSTLLPVVNVRMYVPSCLTMNGSGVSVLEICSAIPLAERIRTGQKLADTGLEEGDGPLRQIDPELGGFGGRDGRDGEGAEGAEDKTLQAMTTIPTHHQ